MTTNTTTAERRLRELGLKLAAPPEPFGTYVEAVQTYALEKVAEAYARMMSGDAQFRVVLTM